MKKVAKFILKITGWDIKDYPVGVEKAIVAMGPHTSNWDFIIGRLAFWNYGIKASFLIKKELFIPPFGWFLRKMGGIPVNRGKHNHFTDQATDYFQNNETMYMVFTPEGTRKYNPNWKKGFYYIALKAEVPIYLAYIDYKNKTGGFHNIFHPTGNIEKDIAFIKKELSQYQGKYPEHGIKSPEKE